MRRKESGGMEGRGALGQWAGAGGQLVDPSVIGEDSAWLLEFEVWRWSG